jgi:hypothetical protein
MDTSENKEAVIVSVGSASGAISAYLLSQPIPNEVKAPACAILGAVSVGLLAYWKARVNKIAT